MREIKFRAWSENLREMIWIDSIEWDLCEFGDNQISGYTNSDWVHKIPTNEVKLMQYTGLKDKNGKEIYEGDIVDIGNGEKFLVGWHEYIKEFTFVKNKNYFPKTYRGASRDTWVVIGNIYENKDLLEDIE